MKKIFYTLLVTLSGVVLLFSYHTSTEVVAAVSDDIAPVGTPKTTSGVGAAPSAAASSSKSSSAAAGGSTASSSAASTGTYKDGTYTGSAVNTRYGKVQVKVTVSGGAITSVDAPQYPNSGGMDQMINSQAIPMLASEAVAAQSANIDMVSGATYTSKGYISSLQSALDQAAR